MNPHRKFKNNGPDGFGLVLMVLVMCFVVFVAIVVEPTHKKNIEKSITKNKPVDRQKILLNDLSGNVESIHPWGRTEVVPIKNVELEYFEYCDQWVMSGDVVQPVGRKGYFMPVMKGHLDLNVKYMTETWVEYGSYATGPEEGAETYEDFRMAHILVKSGRVVNIKYSHYRLDSNKSWSIIAVWEAIFNESN